jgi:hypothetical protein
LTLKILYEVVNECNAAQKYKEKNGYVNPLLPVAFSSKSIFGRVSCSIDVKIVFKVVILSAQLDLYQIITEIKTIGF